jgi:hypothetical protein
MEREETKARDATPRQRERKLEKERNRPSSAHNKKKLSELAIEAAAAAPQGQGLVLVLHAREPYSLFLNLSSPITHQYTHAPHPAAAAAERGERINSIGRSL